MRFRARVESSSLPVLAGVVAALERMGPSAVLHLSEDFVRFSVLADVIDGGVQSFAEISRELVFREYLIESQADNCILLEVLLSNLSKALASGAASPITQIKLAKRGDTPCLSVATRALEVQVQHDIPVRVLRSANVAAHAPPALPPPVVQLELAEHRTMRGVLERLGRMGKVVSLDADMRGSLQLCVRNEHATVRAFFANQQPRFDGMEDPDACAGNRAQARVDVRRLAWALSPNVAADSVILCLVAGRALVVHMELPPGAAGTLTFYVPVQAADPDEEPPPGANPRGPAVVAA